MVEEHRFIKRNVISDLKGGIISGDGLTEHGPVHLVGAKASKSYAKNGNDKGYNVISDVGTNNNNPFANMYLDLNAPPMALPVADRQYSVQPNNSIINEYTIGGVLSGAEGINHHFIQILNVSIPSQVVQ